jgi:hypothetical protein
MSPDTGRPSDCPAGAAVVSDICVVTPVDAPECAIVPVAIDTARLCPNESACPVTTLLQLGCGTDNVVSLDARGQDSASLIVNRGPDVDLYELGPPGTRQVRRFAQFVNSTVRSDREGEANIFVESGQPGVWRVHETPNGWVREDVQAAPSDDADVVDARIIDDTHMVVTISDAHGISTLARDAAGWRTTRVDAFMGNEVIEGSVGMNVDRGGQPWLAAITYLGAFQGHTPTSFLDVVGPDGTFETIRSLVGDFPIEPPILLPGGVSGTDDHPAIVYQQGDGVHVALPPVDSQGWSDRLLPGSAPSATLDTSCPDPNAVLSPCPGTSCSSHAKGTTGGIGFARTVSGAAFVAWLDGEAEISTDLVGSAASCGATAPVAAEGTTTIAVARLPLDPGVPVVVQRFQLDGPALPPSRMAMTARGDTLLIAAQATGVDSANLWYLEVDSTQLP